MSLFPEVLENRLENLVQSSSLRVLSMRAGVDFSSNDYLGFSQDEDLRAFALSRIKDVPLGASASRLLRGQLPVFDETERILADFCSQESALLYSSGYQANLGLLSSILTSEDLVLSDQFNHASIIDGIRLSGAKKAIYPHLDLNQLRNLLEEAGSKNPVRVIVTESLFGMEGDQAPLDALADLAEEFSALLVVDEAHATGIWGNSGQNRGGGLVQSQDLSSRVFATVHTGGKALGLGGAWICGSQRLKDYLVNFSRPMIFSTAPIPIQAVLLQSSVQHWRQEGAVRAARVLEKAALLRSSLQSLPIWRSRISNSVGPVVPIVIGENREALRLARVFQESGFDVRAIRPPTVPEGSARLRLCINWNQSIEDIQKLMRVFEKN